MLVSAGEPTEWVAEQMGHLDGRLVAAVYGRWLRHIDLEPGEQAATAYATEWQTLAGQVETVNTVDDVPEDGPEEAADDGDDGEEGEF